MPSTDWVDEYIASVEEYVVSSFAFVSDINAINDSVNRLWGHVSRFGPPEMPDLGLRGLGRFEVPPPPPPPPLPPASPRWHEEVADWASRNRVLVGTLCVGAVGAGLLAGYSASAYTKARTRTRHAQKTIGSNLSSRRLLVVVLGGDSPLGAPLIAGLEKEGYIVITSVSDPDAVAEIEANGNGFVRALIFDPSEPSTLQPFLRSLKATLSLRFPLNSAGDPYQHSSASFPILFSVISLLTLPSTSASPSPTPFESLDLSASYGPFLTRTHIMPLQAIQALLPLFRVDSIRSKDATYYFGGRKSIIFCVPAVDARVGAPYTSAQGMASAATVRGAEVLRRELQQVADPHMHDIRVVIADVGVIGSAKAISVWGSLESSVQSWTPGEQKVYGSPYTTFLSAIGQRTRAPSSIKLFVKTIVQTVGKNALKGERVSTFAVGLRLWSHRFLQEFRGARFSVGAGAIAYTLVSYLPNFLLDALLNLPATTPYFRGKVEYMPTYCVPTGNELVAVKMDPPLQTAEDVAAEIPEDTPKPSALSENKAAVNDEQSAVSESLNSSGVENSWISVQD